MTKPKTILPLAAALAVALPGGSALAAPKAKIKYAANAVVVGENAGTATLSLTRTGKDLSAEASVGYSTLNGTAVAPSDYTASSGRATFPATTAKTQTVTVEIPITNDASPEITESFQVVLRSPSRNSVAVNPKATVTIADDDGASRIEYAQPTFRVSEAEAVATITVVRSGSTVAEARVTYATSDGSATVAGSDYTAATGELVFAPGDVVEQFNVSITPDDTPETSEETIGLGLSSMTGAVPGGNALSTLTIVDDDSTPLVQFGSDSLSTSVDESDVNGATLSLVRSGTLSGSVTVDYTTTDGTALAGSDFVPAPVSPDNQLTFAAGEYEQIVSIGVNEDTVDEVDETFSVGLENALYQGTTDALGANDSASVTILDNDTAPADNGDDGSNGGGATVINETTNNTTTVANTNNNTTQGGDQIVLGARQSACGLITFFKKTQKVLKQKALRIGVQTRAACKLSVSATVTQVKASKKTAKSARALRFKGKGTKLALQPNKAKTVKVKFTKKTLKAIKKALQARKKLVATVVVTTRDAASKVNKKTLKITIKR